MNVSKTTRARRLSQNPAGLSPLEELFAHPGEQDVVDPGPPLTPDEQFRERVATAWAWVKTVRFYEHEHERLARVLVGMITAGNR